MLDETCRDLMAERKIAYTDELNEAKDEAIADMAECREDYVNDLLELKEALKKDLRDLLNQVIWDIKELKVEGLLNEAGMPTEEHSAQIKLMIEAEISGFEQDSNNIINMDWTEAVTDEDGLQE